MSIRGESRIFIRHEVGQHDTEKALRLQARSDSAQEFHGLGNEVDRVSNMNDSIVTPKIEFLELANTCADAKLLMVGFGGRIGVNALRVPVMVGEDSHRFANSACNVEKRAWWAFRERREKS